jgi:acyl-CoA thioesterase FadM
MGTEPELRFVTGSLHVEYHLPTPIDRPMDLRATIKQMKGRKVVVKVSLFSGNKLCAKGEVLAIQVPDKLKNILVAP